MIRADNQIRRHTFRLSHLGWHLCRALPTTFGMPRHPYMALLQFPLCKHVRQMSLCVRWWGPLNTLTWCNVPTSLRMTKRGSWVASPSMMRSASRPYRQWRVVGFQPGRPRCSRTYDMILCSPSPGTFASESMTCQATCRSIWTIRTGRLVVVMASCVVDLSQLTNACKAILLSLSCRWPAKALQ